GGAEFDREIAVRYRIQGVAADFVEAQGARHTRAVDSESGTGQRGRAQRQAVDALAAVAHAFGVAAEHFHIGQHVVAEGDRLSYLEVGEAGEDGGGVLFGQVEQGRAQRAQQADDGVDGATQVEPDVGGDLVV